MADALRDLQELTAVLRVECPWDREQTERTIVPHTVEEAYEVAEAAVVGDPAKLRDELGDLLFQVFFLSRLLDERGEGDLDAVARGVHEKLVRRHPHVFGEAEARTPARVRERWETIKTEQEGREGVFHDVPDSLPALLRARKTCSTVGRSPTTGPISTAPPRRSAKSSPSCSPRSPVPGGPGPRPSPTGASRRSSATCSSRS